MILLDLDGVFVDLHPEVLAVHGIDRARIDEIQPGNWNMYQSFGMKTDHEMWGHPTIQTREFWANLPKTPWADELMAVIDSFFAKDEQCFLTKPLPSSPLSAAAKMDWLAKHYPDRQYLIGGGKKFCAAPNRFLLDDADHNISDFSKCGGHGILFPRRWNKLHFVKDPVNYVHSALTREVRRAGA